MNEDLMLKHSLWWSDKFNELLRAANISQKQLAQFTHVSRSYLNRVLRGKQPLTVKMQNRLIYAFQQMTEITSLTICIDYIRIRFPTHDVSKICEEVLRIKTKYFVSDDYKLYGYQGRYYHGDLEIFFSSPEDSRGTLLELKGKGCRQLERLLIAQGRGWNAFLAKCQMEGGIFKRIDLAINDYLNILPISYFIEKSKRGEYRTKFKSYQIYSRKQYGVLGQTLYFGSRKSDIYFCLYQKDIEQFFKNDTDVTNTDIKNRFEVRLANDRATATVNDLLNFGDPRGTVMSVVSKYLTFLKVDKQKNKAYWPVDEIWQCFVGNKVRDVKLVMDPEPFTLANTQAWLKKQVMPSFKMIHAIDSARGTDVLTEMLVNTKLTSKQQKIIEQVLANPEEIVIENSRNKE
ncbi:XRE family transcriptional regulator [Pediococcus acidilactici]|uniref:XRE family transcriptional regulator n=1 Tax=Pediococcus acidilactici TaxID=1254 RepID=UPI001950B382|nr:XRE family transcriptional regulator [Pediococcus acidilactici]MBM6586263.1 XRE family transcriptional regulator [Pediococcus acidilactici]